MNLIYLFAAMGVIVVVLWIGTAIYLKILCKKIRASSLSPYLRTQFLSHCVNYLPEIWDKKSRGQNFLPQI